MDLLIAILIAINSLIAPSTVFNQASTPDEAMVKKAQYILDNNLYKVDERGVIIDPDVSL